MEFNVDKESCICCGACAAICDEVFEIDDEKGYAIAKKEVISNSDTIQRAVEAEEGCPTSAITRKETD